MDIKEHHARGQQPQIPSEVEQTLGYQPDHDVEARAHHRYKDENWLTFLISVPLTLLTFYCFYDFTKLKEENPHIEEEVAAQYLNPDPGVSEPLPEIDIPSISDLLDREELGKGLQDTFTSKRAPRLVGKVNRPETIDEAVLKQLQGLGMTPANLCSDGVFLRRAFLSTLGTIPTVEEARRFLDDEDPNKRARLVDELLERPEFADYMAMKWCDILRVKAEFPIKLWPNAAQAYHRWIRTAIDQKMPYDEFVYELLTSSGSNFRTPQVNFYRAVQSKEPNTVAQAVALTFLCQRTDQWPRAKLSKMSLFFSQIGFKPTGEWKEEIVYFDRSKSLGTAPEYQVTTFPDGAVVTLIPGEDPRLVFANWLTSPENEAFAKAISNRIWYWVYGRGIVEEPDDMRQDNPPSNPELLNLLAYELVESGFDLRHLYRLILNSQTYQLSCVPNNDHPEASRFFAYYPTRRLEAEVLIDVINKITGTSEIYSSIIPEPFTFLPENQRAVALPDGSITSSFLEMFGRPARDTGLESERNNKFTPAQALHLLNSNHIRKKIEQGQGLNPYFYGNVTENIYLAVLSRYPTDDELSHALSMGVYGPNRELVWVLINSDEFLFQH